ncbi:MAG TPA: chemotaxis response regulator protein-glutamate methylesterase [Bacillota bacterium]|nr:chemotaxis response regulator protein-glutamate methylesterase [Bacillota bacterium]
MREKIRVLVIDDSAFMRKMITDILSSDHRITVIGTARNGEIGLRKMKELQPDVITLDVEMPVMDGLSTLKEIMNNHPIPVVMISGTSNQHMKKTIQAISNGAIDFVAKPSGTISVDIKRIEQEIISKVITASQVDMNVITKQKKFTSSKLTSFNQKETLICIGTSTGGPKALETILKSIPKELQASILIVQHMPEQFTKSFAQRLNQIAHIPVKEARHHEQIKEGHAYVAPGNYHMLVQKKGKDLKIVLSKEEKQKGHRPSVDVLLQSVSQLNECQKIAIILTGMGKDGAKGVVELKKADKHSLVITESEQTALIYGMPSAAKETGHVNYTLPVHQISELLVDILIK